MTSVSTDWYDGPPIWETYVDLDTAKKWLRIPPDDEDDDCNDEIR